MVQATQTVAGVTSDSTDFRTAFAAAVASVLPTGSTVTIVSVTILNVRYRQLLTTEVSVVYNVVSTATSSTLSSALSSGTAAMSTALQTSYPAAVVATPVVITITASPTTAPVALSTPSTASTSSGTSLVPIIAGAAGGGGLLLLLGLGFFLYRRNTIRKAKASHIHAALPDSAVMNYEEPDAERGLNDNDNNRLLKSKELPAPITPIEIAVPSINFNGTTSIDNKLQSTVTTTLAMGGSTVRSAVGGGGTKQSIGSSAATVTFQIGPDGSTPIPVITTSSLASIDWSNLALAARIGSGSFSAVCKYSCLNPTLTLPKL